MIIDLANVQFVNDFFSTTLPDGSMLSLNVVDEDFIATGGECTVKAVNIGQIDTEGNYVDCPCVIGFSNDVLKIDTKHTEYKGKTLTPDNMVYCTIEIYE